VLASPASDHQDFHSRLTIVGALATVNPDANRGGPVPKKSSVGNSWPHLLESDLAVLLNVLVLLAPIIVIDDRARFEYNPS
jgi:hypothetical protein